MSVEHHISESPQQQQSTVAPEIQSDKGIFETFTRVVKYASVRALILFTAIAVSVFLTITITNRQLVITSELRGNLFKGWLTGVKSPTRVKHASTSQRISEELYGSAETALGRNLRLLARGMTLSLGESEKLFYYSGGEMIDDVRGIILDSLPRTLLLFGIANLVLFFVTISIALFLYRIFGRWMDRLLTSLSPISAVPSWLYGLIFTVFAAKVLHIFIGGVWDTWPAEFRIEHVPVIAKSLMIPILAIFISKFFQSIYTWRNYFQINLGEDFVEMARAKGLPKGMITRNYILRPTLPGIITSFVLIIILIWQEAIVIELFFGVAGIGHLFYNALAYSDLPLIVGLTVTFAYLMAFSILLLDVIYSLVDPRVKISSQGRVLKAAKRTRKFRLPGISFRNKKPNPGEGQTTSEKSGGNFSATMSGIWNSLQRLGRAFVRAFHDIMQHQGARIGLVIIAIMIIVSIFTVILIPYDEAISLWRGDGGVWVKNPDNARPTWFNWFNKNKQPSTIILNSADGTAAKEEFDVSDDIREVLITYTFDYPYDGFPQDIVIFFDPQYDVKRPHITFTWFAPDGREIDIGSFSLLTNSEKQSIIESNNFTRKLGGARITEALFADPNAHESVAMRGSYTLQMSALMFEDDADIDAEMVLYGQVYGLAGTDNQRRDLMVGLLWGVPVALAFGLLAALGTSFATMAIAAISTWYGGWVDSSIQWITEVNMVLPMFPILLLVFNYYSMRLWTILGVTILLSIFGASIKTYRSIFLQVKEAPYVEAARAYGAGNIRIIQKYLVPRVISVLIPQLIILVPGFVFLEATLAYLGMSDPLLPTWGKIIQEALGSSGLNGDYYWLLEPFALLLVVAFAFLALGYSLERILDPRLRER